MYTTGAFTYFMSIEREIKNEALRSHMQTDKNAFEETLEKTLRKVIREELAQTKKQAGQLVPYSFDLNPSNGK